MFDQGLGVGFAFVYTVVGFADHFNLQRFW